MLKASHLLAAAGDGNLPEVAAFLEGLLDLRGAAPGGLSRAALALRLTPLWFVQGVHMDDSRSECGMRAPPSSGLGQRLREDRVADAELDVVVVGPKLVHAQVEALRQVCRLGPQHLAHLRLRFQPLNPALGGPSYGLTWEAP